MTRRASEAAIERIASALGMKRVGTAYRGDCPSHLSNSGRSFWIGVSAMGNLRLRCYSGQCSYWEIWNALADRGLLRHRPDRQPPSADRSPLKPPLARQTVHIARYGHKFIAPLTPPGDS